MYFNVRYQIASAAAAATSFTTSVVMQNADMASVQVSWSGHNAGGATFHLAGSIDEVNYSSLTSSVITLTSGSSSQLYNIFDIGYTSLKAVYVASAATTGTVDVWVSTKGRR